LRTLTAAVLLTLLVMCALGVPASAGGRIIPSTDHLPLGDWTYDAMMSLAADGLVPGFSARVFQGDRLFNRMEMAEVVASIVESSQEKELGSNQVALLDHLVSEFRPELMSLDPEVVDKWSERSTLMTLPAEGEAFLLGYARGSASDDADDGHSLRVPYRASGLMHLSGSGFVMATAADEEDKFFQELRDSPTPDKAFIRGFDGSFVWSIGREYLSWGPSYAGSLILSDNSPAFVQARGAKEYDFGKLFGRVKITQFVSNFRDSGENLYLFGRRYEKRLSGRWHAGISETAKLSFTPNPLILVMPYYLYQHIFDEVDEEFNTLYGADLSYRARNGSQAYCELVIDDITQPRILGRPKYGRPRKTGYIAGFYIPKVLPGNRLSTFRAEYIYIDRLTYEATRPNVPELAYMYKGDIIGHPIGPNANALYMRGEQYLSDRLSLIAEYFNQRQTDPRDPQQGRRRVVSLMAAYDIAPDKSIAVRVAPYKTGPLEGPAEKGTEYELRASFAF